MGLKKYLFFSILFLVVVGVYAFLTVQGEYTVNIAMMNFSLTLPIAAWVILPAAVLVIATIVHILFYGLKNYLNSRTIEKDEEALTEVIKDTLLENNSSKSFKIKQVKEIANILSQMRLVSKVDDFESSNENIKKIVQAIKKINSGEYVLDKSLKFNKTGQIAKQNLQNRIETDIDFCMDVIKKTDTYSEKEIKQAFLKVISEKSMTTVKKSLENITLDKEILFKLIEKDALNAEFAIENDTLKKYILSVDLEINDYVQIVKLYRKEKQPDDLISLFEALSNEKEEAMNAYFYVLFEFEMIDKARELLNAFGANEFTAYRALIDLKDNGRNYTVDSLCYN